MDLDNLYDLVIAEERQSTHSSLIDYIMDDTRKKVLIRDIKSKMASIEYRPSLITTRFEFKENRKDYQNLISKMKKLGILCGSFSLYVHGLIDRPPNDIDILVDRDSTIIKTFLKKNESKVSKYKEKSSFNNVVDGFEPVQQFESKNVLIDMFHDVNAKYVEYNGFKIQCPFQVIQKKIDIYEAVSRTKDLTDLKLISKRLDEIIEEEENRMEMDYLINLSTIY